MMSGLSPVPTGDAREGLTVPSHTGAAGLAPPGAPGCPQRRFVRDNAHCAHLAVLSAGRCPQSCPGPGVRGAASGECPLTGCCAPPAPLALSPHAHLARRPPPAGRPPGAPGALGDMFPGLGGRPSPAFLCSPVRWASPQRAGPAGRERAWPGPLTRPVLCPQCRRSPSRCRWRAAPASSSVVTSWRCPPASSARSATAATPSSTRRATPARSWSWWQVRPRPAGDLLPGPRVAQSSPPAGLLWFPSRRMRH